MRCMRMTVTIKDKVRRIKRSGDFGVVVSIDGDAARVIREIKRKSDRLGDGKSKRRLRDGISERRLGDGRSERCDSRRARKRRPCLGH